MRKLAIILLLVGPSVAQDKKPSQDECLSALQLWNAEVSTSIDETVRESAVAKSSPQQFVNRERAKEKSIPELERRANLALACYGVTGNDVQLGEHFIKWMTRFEAAQYLKMNRFIEKHNLREQLLKEDREEQSDGSETRMAA